MKALGTRLIGLTVAVTLLGAACSDGNAAIGGGTGTTPTSTSSSTTSPATSTTTSSTTTTSTTTTTTSPPPEKPDFDRVAQATVLIEAFKGDVKVWQGSGTVISPDGLILTNAHVIDDRADTPACESWKLRPCGYDILLISTSESESQLPELRFIGAPVVADYGLDLALLEITSDLDGEPLRQALPYLELGDSDEIGMGEDIWVLGYPSVGGTTISMSEGTVGGTEPDEVLGQSAWIKTDADIHGGNSGGAAVDRYGRLVGVPTAVSTDETSNDSIGWIRPIKLARSMLSAPSSGPWAADADYTSPVQSPRHEDDFGFFGLEFTTRDPETGGPTAGSVLSIDNASAGVCVLINHRGIPNGTAWSDLWLVNGEVVTDRTREWEFGMDEGQVRTCMPAAIQPTEAIVELELWIGELVVLEGSVFVGGNHPPATFELVNESDIAFCMVMVDASGIGGNRLRPGMEWARSPEPRRLRYCSRLPRSLPSCWPFCSLESAETPVGPTAWCSVLPSARSSSPFRLGKP